MPRTIILLTLISCASAGWEVRDVAAEKRIWRKCDKELDGGYADRGICYISQKCKKKVFGGYKCKSFHLFCEWGDLQCYKDQKVKTVKFY